MYIHLIQDKADFETDFYGSRAPAESGSMYRNEMIILVSGPEHLSSLEPHGRVFDQ